MKLAVVFSIVLLLATPVAAQDSACEEHEKLIEEAEQLMEEANSSEERKEIESEYEKRIETAREKCQENQEQETSDTRETREVEEPKENFSVQDIEERPGDVNLEPLDEKTCRERASSIKSELVKSIESSSLMEVDRPVENFMRNRAKLAARCDIFSRQGRDLERERTETAPAPERSREKFDARIELDESFPEKCRERAENIRQKYVKKSEKGDIPVRELEDEYRQEVNRMVRSCGSEHRLVNTSEAPEQMPDSCVNKMEELNQEIKANTDAEIGDPVPEQYVDRYKKATKNCMRSAATQKVTEAIGQKVDEIVGGSGDSENLQKKLEEKNRRIKQLEEKVAELQGESSGETGEPIQEPEPREQESRETGEQQRPGVPENSSDQRTAEPGTDPGPESGGQEKPGEPSRRRGIIDSVIGSILG